MRHIDEIKVQRRGTLKYKLKEANVYCSPEGFHFIDYLDPLSHIDPEIDGSTLTEEEVRYNRTFLESNPRRLQHQVDLVSDHSEVNEARVLDIGSGAGRFLSEMARRGAEVTGIELSNSRAYYASQRYGIKIVKRSVEDDYWRQSYGTYDIVTLWDVIEHVNFPYATLNAAVQLLKPGGKMFVDTPCRDSFYHRFGELTYTVSGGRLPTFLNIMYTARPFGHKQIFATDEMRQLLVAVGMEVVVLHKFHELSLPTSFYLRKLLRSEFVAGLAAPVADKAIKLFPIQNKMVAVARRDYTT